MRIRCSILRELLTWFSFGKEVTSPTKIIGLMISFLIFVETELILVSFYC